jgi:signal transduction histidine kinase
MLVKLERLKIQELLFDSALKYELIAQSKGIQIKSQICQNLPIVLADLSLIDRVIQNLLDNAVKYTPQQGQILIDACAGDHGGVNIKIRNSGNGIPKAELKSLFDRYYMIDKDQQGVQGSGLGLAIVKHILEIHGSEIKIHSDSETYTEFEFDLMN